MLKLEMVRLVKAYLDPDEIKKLENAAKNLRDKLLIRVLFPVGVRVSEALALKVDDIDFNQTPGEAILC